jgi:hypothetical protein
MPGEILLKIDNRGVAGIFDPQTAGRQTDSFDGTVREPLLFAIAKPIDSNLQRGGTAVDTQNDVRHLFLRLL